MLQGCPAGSGRFDLNLDIADFDVPDVPLSGRLSHGGVRKRKLHRLWYSSTDVNAPSTTKAVRGFFMVDQAGGGAAAVLVEAATEAASSTRLSMSMVLATEAKANRSSFHAP
jgi:hypothetical protein